MSLGPAPLPYHIDSTMIVCFRSCPQKFWLEFCHGLRPSGISIDLHAGACFAAAIEEVRKQVWIHNRPLDDALIHAHARFVIEWGDFEIPQWKSTAKSLDRTWDAVEHYFAEHSPRTDHIQPYFATDGTPTLEYSFAIPLDDPDFPRHPLGGDFVYCGRFDALGQLHGSPVIEDDKTTGSIGQDWVKKWTLRNQFMGYIWACRQCGIPVKEAVTRGIAIQKSQIILAEAVVSYSDELLARWYDQLHRDMWRLRRCYDEGYWDYNFGDTCTAYGLCMFMNMCSSASPESWATTFEVRHWNPLNKNPVAVSTTEDGNE